MRHAVVLRQTQARAVLDAAASIAGLASTAQHVDDAQISAIAAMANASVTAHDDPGAIQFLVREPTRLASSDRPVSTSVPSELPSPCGLPSHGFARRMRVRPRGWHVVLSLDGIDPIDVPRGAIVDLQMEPRRDLWLRTLTPV